MENQNTETLSTTIQKQIDNTIQTIPYPIKCTITKVYEDKKHVDINSELGELKYIEVIANNPTTNNNGILIFLNGSNDEFIVITK